MAKKSKSTYEQTFAYRAPAALSVQLVGDFTHWQKTPFLVDGQWQDDPECTLRLLNPFGSENMIREVA